jgi:hypothetical protein
MRKTLTVSSANDRPVRGRPEVPRRFALLLTTRDILDRRPAVACKPLGSVSILKGGSHTYELISHEHGDPILYGSLSEDN